MERKEETSALHAKPAGRDATDRRQQEGEEETLPGGEAKAMGQEERQ